jgi:pantothenate kinase-related protein Tda10
LLEKRNEQQLLTVGIEDKGCSGKSRLATGLRNHILTHGIPAETVSIDDFCNERVICYAKDVKQDIQVYHRNFDEKRGSVTCFRSARGMASREDVNQMK